MTILMISRSRGGHIGFFLIEKGPRPPSISGYADGHRVQIYVSITNTEGVIVILMLAWSRGGHIRFSFLEIIRGPGPPRTSGYADGQKVQMYVSITNTEVVMAIFMISWSGGGHIGFF